MSSVSFTFFSSWVKSNYKRVVACAAIANSDDEEWDFALERYLSTDLSSEKEMLLSALSCSNSPEALNTYTINEIFYTGLL
jgi:aminopeptidase N